jgi:hypothetical protein
MRREVAVDLETWVVGGIEGDVEDGPRQAVVAYELVHQGLQLAAGELRVACDGLLQPLGGAVAVGSLDDRFDGLLVVEL